MEEAKYYDPGPDYRQDSAIQPPVVTWFKIYSAFMAFMYFSLFVLGIAGITGALGELPGAEEFGETDDITIVEVVIFLVISTPLMILFGVGPLLPRRPWAWIFGIVLIAFGLTSFCCLPATIPLLIFWLKPDCSVYFGRKRRRDPDEDLY